MLLYLKGKSLLDFAVVFFKHLLTLPPFVFLCFLKLYNYFEDSNYVYLVLEMCHNGEMSRYLKDRKKPFTEEEGKF